MNPSVVKKGKWIARNVLIPSVFMSMLIITVVFLGGPVSQVFAQSPSITEREEKPPYDLMETQGDQISQDTQTPANISQAEEDELMAFDPSTVPESVPLSDADWVFSVPVDIKNMSKDVKGINVECAVHPEKGANVYGWAKKTVPLTEGSYQGDVIIGVDAFEKKEGNGKRYRCSVYLFGSDGKSQIPTTDMNATPRWRMVSSDEPFKHSTGIVNLPDGY